MASLMETAEASTREGCDSARARRQADSALAHEGMTRTEFLAGLHALEREPERWRTVSEEASRIMEQRIAARTGAR